MGCWKPLRVVGRVQLRTKLTLQFALLSAVNAGEPKEARSLQPTSQEMV